MDCASWSPSSTTSTSRTANWPFGHTNAAMACIRIRQKPCRPSKLPADSFLDGLGVRCCGEYFAPKSTDSMSQFPAGVLDRHLKCQTPGTRQKAPVRASRGQCHWKQQHQCGHGDRQGSVNSPVIIQFSNGGAKFNAGKSLSMDAINNLRAWCHCWCPPREHAGRGVWRERDSCTPTTARATSSMGGRVARTRAKSTTATGKPLFSSHD